MWLANQLFVLTSNWRLYLIKWQVSIYGLWDINDIMLKHIVICGFLWRVLRKYKMHGQITKYVLLFMCSSRLQQYNSIYILYWKSILCRNNDNVQSIQSVLESHRLNSAHSESFTTTSTQIPWLTGRRADCKDEPLLTATLPPQEVTSQTESQVGCLVNNVPSPSKFWRLPYCPI